MSDEQQVQEAPEVIGDEGEVEAQAAPAAQVKSPPTAPKVKIKAPELVDDQGQEDKPRSSDPMMKEMVRAQKELDAMRRELAEHRAKVKQFERDQKKQAVLSALYEEFPGIPSKEIRGAALVAAEDGEVDLYGEDPKEVIAKIKESLRPKSKKSATAATSSLGGTPGNASKPPATTRKFLI